MTNRAVATFDLPGDESSRLRCTACANRACEALGDLVGVIKIDCDIPASAVRVEFDTTVVSEPELAAQMERFGLELARSVRHAAWRVTGLD